LTAENAELKSLKEENRILREHLNFLDEREFKYVIANVIARSDLTAVSDSDQALTIDKGFEHGLVPGSVVLSDQGIVVGKITDVKKNTARVSLITSNECKLAVTIQGRSMTSGIAEGNLGLTVTMNFIPKQKRLAQTIWRLRPASKK